MRHLRLATVLAGAILTGPLTAPASAVTVEELFNLKANGLSDEILVALIESDGSVFRLQPEDVIILYRRGLSERVILAMIATSRRFPVPIPADEVPQPPAQQTLTQPSPIQPTVIQPIQLTNVSPVDVYSPVEVYVPVPISVFTPVSHKGDRFDRVDRLEPSRVYWGFGGQLRPDAWEPRVPPRDSGRDRKEPERDRKPESPGPSTPARRR